MTAGAARLDADLGDALAQGQLGPAPADLACFEREFVAAVQATHPDPHTAWDALPDELKREVEGLQAEHWYLAKYEELRQRNPATKVVFVSGYAEEAFRKNLPEGEDFQFLPKPFTMKQLVETVKAAMA